MKFRFEIQIKPKDMRADKGYSTHPPSEYPSFVLCFNYNWADGDYHTTFGLHFWQSENSRPIVLGELRLMKRGVENTYYYIKDQVFSEFDESYCSVGINIDYYKKLTETFDKETRTALLKALRDCSIDVDIQKQFREDIIYKTSIVRSIDVERAIRMSRFVLSEASDDAFSFSFVYHAPYARTIDVPFKLKWKNTDIPYERWAGVIGSNGSGKTELMKDFIKALWKDSLDTDVTHGYFVDKPVFSSVIALCTTPFDGYQDIPYNDRSLIKYKCRSLEQNKENTYNELKDGIKDIISRGRIGDDYFIKDYERFLGDLLDPSTIAGLIKKPDIFDVEREIDVDCKILEGLVNHLSSGQLHLMTLVTYVYQYVYYDTLFVLDEPEVHLHPHAIMDFMFLLSKLLDKFESYALVATHSPLVIREMIGDHVFVLRRHENNSPNLAHLDFESFGEDVTLLYKKIFGYDENESVFMRTVKKMVDDGRTYDDIVNSIQTTMPLSLNSRMSINNMIAIRDYYRNEENPG